MANRAQRRQLLKQKLTPKELTDLLNQKQTTGILQTAKAMMLVTAYELHRKNLPKEDIVELLKRIEYTFDSIQKDYIKLSDIEEVLKNELNL